MTVLNYYECPPPAISRQEILRYMRCPSPTLETEKLIDDCLEECKNSFSYKAIYTTLPVTVSDSTVTLGNEKITVKSADLSKNLSNCHSAILFAATVGIKIDRLIIKYSRLNPSKTLCLQAIGAERAEALCDGFNLYIKERAALEGKLLHPRFSPGYGDFPLAFQRKIFNILMCEKNLGLTLNDSLLMSPTKSVTAIIGISDTPKQQSQPPI